ncbi:MAG TPA: lysophospholipid acyltransferase family protein [Pirellulaceae bacterium]|nr:lysophospholipid acyltransferase family protein [Pirellulaceae bacterium]
MKLRGGWLWRGGGLALSTVLRMWMSTLDCRALFLDPTTDAGGESFQGPVIFLLWHEYIPVPVYLRPNCDIALLVSRHADAEWLTQAVRYFGFSTVRGSSARGGAAALLELLNVGGNRSLAITPDGPRGPRREVAQGPIYLSSVLQIPLVLIASGYDRPWRLPTWDRFAIPRPGSRCRTVLGGRIQIPPQLDRDGIEEHRLRVQQYFDRLTTFAEDWAESGRRVAGEQVVHRRRGRPRNARS